MSKKMRKNGFVEGAAIAYVAIVLVKLMGALYNIPFYSIIGDEGGVVYSYAYNVYTLFLDISTSGVPIAISILISEYNAAGKYLSRQKAYSLGLYLVVGISALAFLFLQIFARQVGAYFIGDMTEGVTVEEVAVGIRAVSFSLLIVPSLSMKRGYLQGHKFFGPPSTSQVIEQFVRIAVVLLGSYLVIKVLKGSVTAGVCVALFGAAVGALIAYLYLSRKHRLNRGQFSVEGAAEEKAEPNKAILKKLLTYCLTIVLVSVTMSIYSIVDLKMLLTGLHRIGYADTETQIIASINSTWIPKICMIITALSMGFTSSIAPHVAESFSQGDLRGANHKINRAMGTTLVVTFPLGAGIIVLAEPVYRVFYGSSAYGGSILQFAVIINIVGSLTSVIGMAMQSLNCGKVVCLHTIVGVVLNMALDLPLIYGFHALGLPAYLGAPTASIIGQAATLALMLSYLRKTLSFSYGSVWRVFWRSFLPMLLMAGVVILMKLLWPVADGRGVMLLVQLAAFAAVGALIYLPLTYKTKALQDALGEELLSRVFKKLKLRK